MSNGLQQTQIIITMAGFGRRFREAGYDVPKYQIEAHGLTLFHWSLASLRSFTAAGARVLLISRAADHASKFIEKEMPALAIENWSLLELDAPTDGQATTAMRALPMIDSSRPILIYNIDTFVDPRFLPVTAVRGDGWMPCFPGQGDAWSFARTEEDSDLVLETREKKRISPHATIGLYWFDSGALYADLYRNFHEISAPHEAGERYIAPMYNQLIKNGGAVYLHRVPTEAVHPLGTPEDVKKFIAGKKPI